MRFSGSLFALLLIALVAAEDATLPREDAVASENDQDPLGEFLGNEPETEASENTESVLDKLFPTEEENEEPLEDETDDTDEEEEVEDEDVDVVDEDKDEDETAEAEDEDIDVVDEEDEETFEEDVVEDPEAEAEDEDIDVVDEDKAEDEDIDVVDKEDKETFEEDVVEEPEDLGKDEDEETFEEDVVEEPEDLGKDKDDDPSKNLRPTRSPTPAPEPFFTPYPTVYSKPSLRPVAPYVSKDDDPLKNDNDEAFNDWGFNQATVDEVEKDVEEMAHDTKVVIALSTVFGLMFFFSVYVAYQMLENPNGICASICRISVAFWCGLTRCICWPCRKMCGCTGNGQSNRQDHMMLSDEGHFTNDLELS